MAERAEELADVGSEELGPSQRREVAIARHFGPALDLEEALCPLARRVRKPFGAVMQLEASSRYDATEVAESAPFYDTTRESYGNDGHTFAAGSSDEERRDLLEYLTTL